MRYLFLFFITFLSTIPYAQIEVRNYSLIYPEEDVIYRNLPNIIDIMNVKNDSITLISGADTIERSERFFIYEPKHSFDSDTLKVLLNHTYWGEVIFRVETLREPTVFLGDLRESNVRLDYLLSNPGIQVTYEPQLFIPHIYVISCELVIVRQGKKEQRMRIIGNAFSDKQLKRLSNLKSGDIILFKDISFSNTDFHLFERDLQLTIIE